MKATALKQLRQVLSVMSGATPESGKPEYWDGDLRWVTPEDVGALDGYLLSDTRRRITTEGYNSCGTSMAPRGAIVLTKRAPIGQAAVLAEPACSNQGCFLLTPRGEQDSRYYYYWLTTQTDRLQALGRGSTFMELSTDDLKALPVPEPLPQRQRAIADYLDRETSRIDALVAAKEQVLKLLAEKRQALITHAVTHGINLTVQFKETACEWIPRAPAHWTPTRVGRLFRQVKRLGYPNEPVLSVYRDYGVIERSSRDDNANRIPEDLDKYQLVNPNDLVINKMKAWQGSLGISPLRGITSPDYVVFAPDHSEEPSFLHILLRNSLLTTAYLSMSNGIRTNQWRIEPERFLSLQLFMPPVSEQREIVEFVSCKTSQIEETSLATERTISLLRERRAAIVAAAVTGQVEAA